MPQRKTRPSTAAERANEALDKAAPTDKTPARKALAFLLEGSHDEPSAPLPPSDGQTPSVPQTTLPPAKPAEAIAPERDFNRRANSLERDALPSGLFPGSSKKIYDALYLRTRGAVKPIRTIRATKKDIADWSGIKNRKTIDGHLRYLETCRLIERQWELGRTDGYLYEVRLPEETPLVDRGGQRGRPLEGTDQNLVRGTDQKRDSDGQSQAPVLSAISGEPKTFKTNTERSDDDDAALADLVGKLKRASKEITGREPSPSESTRWGELAELLVTEAKIAAARTTVSSLPAFLTEHLRRRLWKKEKTQLEAEQRTEQQSSESVALSEEQIKGCPDCGGSTWYYPEGTEKGIKRCRHEKLRDSEAQKQ